MLTFAVGTVDQVLIGVDLGTSSVKATAFGHDGRVHAEATHSYPTQRHGPRVAEQDPQRWWSAVCAALQELTTRLPSSRIAGVGLSGQIGTHVLVDSDLDPLGPAYTWQDGRIADSQQHISERLSPAEATMAMGAHLPALGAWPLNRLVWLRDYSPESLERAALMLQPKDFILHKLTGRVASDASSWRGIVRPDGGASHLLDVFGLPSIVPAIIRPDEVVGTISQGASLECGLPASTPVVAGWNDLNCSVVGAGLCGPGTGFDVTGTSEHIGQICRSPGTAPGLVSYPIELDGSLTTHLVYGVSSNCGNVVTWLKALLAVPPGAGADRACIDQSISETTPGADGLSMLPYLSGERSPIWDPNATGVLSGLTSTHQSSHLIRAALEGVVFNLRRIVELLDSDHGSVYRAVGGPAQLDTWTQMKADVLNVRIELTDVPQSAPLGAAMLAAVGIGWHPHVGAAAAAMTRVARAIEPNVSRRTAYEDAYGAFLARAEVEERVRGRGIR